MLEVLTGAEKICGSCDRIVYRVGNRWLTVHCDDEDKIAAGFAVNTMPADDDDMHEVYAEALLAGERKANSGKRRFPCANY